MIKEHYVRCGDSSCHCMKEGGDKHGPYKSRYMGKGIPDINKTIEGLQESLMQELEACAKESMLKYPGSALEDGFNEAFTEIVWIEAGKLFRKWATMFASIYGMDDHAALAFLGFAEFYEKIEDRAFKEIMEDDN